MLLLLTFRPTTTYSTSNRNKLTKSRYALKQQHNKHRSAVNGRYTWTHWGWSRCETGGCGQCHGSDVEDRVRQFRSRRRRHNVVATTDVTCNSRRWPHHRHASTTHRQTATPGQNNQPLNNYTCTHSSLDSTYYSTVITFISKQCLLWCGRLWR